MLTCARKKRYNSQAAAWSVIFKLRARGQDIDRLTAEECPGCKHWHLVRGEPSQPRPARPIRDVLPVERE